MIDEDLGLHQHFSIHFWQSIQFLPVMSFTLICCSVSTTTFYMLAPELRDCTIYYTSYDLVLGDLVTYMIRHLVSTSLIRHICDSWTLIQTYTSGPCSDDSLCTFSSAILLYILDLLCTFYMDIFLTEHGYARLSLSWLSVFFHWFLAGWNLVKSSLVLAKFFLCA